ncbi:MAG: TetR/AcrR family transcriptional regulator [Deinococcota bacterium]
MTIFMTKGERTKQHIIEKAMPVFSQQGLAGTSMADLVAATGLQKGGIYGHFKSKDALALAAFDYAFARATNILTRALETQQRALDRLSAVVDAFLTMTQDATFVGGCHLLNTAVDSDDTHPALRQKVQVGLEQWQNMICNEVSQGIAQGELQPRCSANDIAIITIAMLEGGMMLTKAHGQRHYLERVAEHLKTTFKEMAQ